MDFEILSAAAVGEIPNWFAVAMGIGTVFVGLISIIIICVITGAVCGASQKAKKTGVSPGGKGNEKNLETVAAVCAACAEEMGTDVNSLKVISFKKI